METFLPNIMVKPFMGFSSMKIVSRKFANPTPENERVKTRSLGSRFGGRTMAHMLHIT